MPEAAQSASLSVEALYNAHHSWLHQVLRRRLGCSEDAADLAHDAFIRLLNKPREFNHRSARAYLNRMAQGLCVDLWRRREIEQAWQDTLANLPEPLVPSAQQQVEVIEALTEVDAMLSQLPAAVSQTFVMNMVQGLSGKEIAAELGVTDRTVRNYLSRAMLACLRLQERLAYTD